MRTSPLVTLISLFLFTVGLHAAVPAASLTAAVNQEYRGWRDAIVLRNTAAEVTIVPSIGRVMDFRFAGETDGPFWVNEKLVGQPMPSDPWRANPGSFGGDKTWPAPQSGWNWPPPAAFDAVAVTAQVNPDQSVTLVSPVAATSGMRAVRRIVLDPTAPILRIETSFEKISGAPVDVSVWVITQLRHPVGIYVPVPANSIFPTGFATSGAAPGEFLTREGDLLRMTRDPRRSHKITNDASTLVWAGEKHLLRIDAPRIADAKYPEGGSSIQVYTNQDPVAYVELETFGPLKTLNSGENLKATNTYRLARRTGAGVDADVRALLAP